METSPTVPRTETGKTYGEYLKVPELLSLQQPQSTPAHHDEMLFIIIHQAYELWFKQILHEMECTRNSMKRGKILRAAHTMKRVHAIMELLVKQIHILETMTPAEFLQFRDKLNPASGFQSLQFRELEFLADLKQEKYLKSFAAQPERLPGRQVGRRHLLDLGCHGFCLRLDHGMKQGLLVGEVMIERAARDAGGLDDLRRAGLGI